MLTLKHLVGFLSAAVLLQWGPPPSAAGDNNLEHYTDKGLKANPLRRPDNPDLSIIAKVNSLASRDKQESFIISVAVSQKESEKARMTAIAMLGRFKTEKSIAALMSLLHYPSYLASHTVVMASLWEIGEPSVPLLLKFIDDKSTSDDLQFQAVRALMTIKGKGYTPYLKANYEIFSERQKDAIGRFSVT